MSTTSTATAARVLGNSALVLNPFPSPQGQLAFTALEVFQLTALQSLLLPFTALNGTTLLGSGDDFLAVPIVVGPRLLCYMVAQAAGV